jgi:hypothetical protein
VNDRPMTLEAIAARLEDGYSFHREDALWLLGELVETRADNERLKADPSKPWLAELFGPLGSPETYREAVERLVAERDVERARADQLQADAAREARTQVAANVDTIRVMAEQAAELAVLRAGRPPTEKPHN